MRGLSCFTILALVACCACADVPNCGPGSPTHIAHPTDCTKYYTCANGVAILQQCPPGLWWDDQLEGCDFPAHVNCAAGSTTPGQTTVTVKTTTGGNTPPIETTTSGNTELPDCHGTSDTLLPHPTDCTMFYKCLEGVPYPIACPPGLWWHQEILACDWPELSECHPGETRPPTEEPATTPGGSTTEGLPTEPPAGLPDRCPAAGVEGEIVRLPHETNCRFYYRCDGGNQTLYVCPPDQHFSPTRRMCRDRVVAGCESCPPVDEEGEEVRLPHENDCHLYYLCKDGDREAFQCRNVWHFSRAVRECMEPELAKCAKRSLFY